MISETNSTGVSLGGKRAHLHSGGHKGHGTLEGHIMPGFIFILLGLHCAVAIMLLLKNKKRNMLSIHVDKRNESLGDGVLLDRECETDIEFTSESDYNCQFLIQPFYSASYILPPSISHRQNRLAPLLQRTASSTLSKQQPNRSNTEKHICSLNNVILLVDRLEPIFTVTMALVIPILVELPGFLRRVGERHDRITGQHSLFWRLLFDPMTGKISMKNVRTLQHGSVYGSVAIYGICCLLSGPSTSSSRIRAGGLSLPSAVPLLTLSIVFLNLAMLMSGHGLHNLGDVVAVDHLLFVYCAIATAGICILQTIIVSFVENTDLAETHTNDRSDRNSISALNQLQDSFIIAISRPFMFILTGNWMLAIGIVEHTNGSLVDPTDMGAPLFVPLLFTGLWMSTLLVLVIMYYVLVVCGNPQRTSSSQS